MMLQPMVSTIDDRAHNLLDGFRGRVGEFDGGRKKRVLVKIIGE